MGIDNGFSDATVASQVASTLERCGHLGGSRVKAFEQALDDLSDAEADLCGAMASDRQLSHCNAVLQANLQRAGEA